MKSYLNIENIDYNFLNLPSQIEMADIDGISKNNFMQYHYLSDGQKLSQKVFTNGEVSTTRDYCGRFVYENGKLSYIINADGLVRAVYNDPQALTMIEPEINICLYPGAGEYLKGFTREIHLKEHLGNVRAVFDYSKLQSENHYYPFGLPIHNLCTSTAPEGKENRYLYNGKELQDDLGLNWMDYGARFYDAGIGRFHTQDRFAEKYLSLTSYQYAANNPVLYIDVNGDSLAVTGDQTAIDKFVNIANTGLGANYNVSVGDDGVVSVVTTGAEEEMTDEQKAFLDVMDGITTSQGVATVGLVESDENVLIGSFALESVDVDDVAQFPTTGPSTAAGTLSHELVEQSAKQLDGNGYPIAHYVKGIGAEDKVNNSTRGSVQPTSRITTNSSGQQTGNIDMPYVKGTTISKVSIHLINNNVTKVEIK